MRQVVSASLLSRACALAQPASAQLEDKPVPDKAPVHGLLDIVNADVPYEVLQRAVPIHPTVSELIPTLLSEMKPAD